jgi:hypothetical protein
VAGEPRPEGKLLIGIDEVDRIVDPEFAERFLNEVKAIFDVPNCIYVVSVSEEALANFERRVVRVRTAFDSAFDDIVRLRALTVGESVELLRRRVAGVPDRFLVLCHYVGGGMPREVLRAARTMLDVHREQAGSSSLADLTRKLVAREIAALKRGFLVQTDGGSIDPALVATASADGWPGERPEQLNAAVGDLLGPQVGRPAPAATELALAAALYFYATILEVFTARPAIVSSLAGLVRRPSMLDDRPPRLRVSVGVGPAGEGLQQWLREQEGMVTEPDQTLQTVVEALADAHRVLPTNASAAVAILSAVRSRLDLPAPGVAARRRELRPRLRAGLRGEDGRPRHRQRRPGPPAPARSGSVPRCRSRRRPSAAPRAHSDLRASAADAVGEAAGQRRANPRCAASGSLP